MNPTNSANDRLSGAASIRHGRCALRFNCVCVSLIMLCSVCCSTQEPSPKMSEPKSLETAASASSKSVESPNRTLLDEANAEGQWFHARKTRPVWARKLDVAQTVKTLEGDEQVAAGHYLCKGEAGDIWPQTEETLLKRYQATDEFYSDGWRMYQPHPDAQGVMATPIDHPFEVQATWGILRGKAGDFLVKNYESRETTYPADVWIVDRTLFGETYETVRP